MWATYRKQAKQYARLSLDNERKLIVAAQQGCARNTEEIVLRHLRFIMGRIHKIAFADYKYRFHEDLTVRFRRTWFLSCHPRNKNGVGVFNPNPILLHTVDNVRTKIREVGGPIFVPQIAA